MLLPPIGWNGPGWISGRTILKSLSLSVDWNFNWDVDTVDSVELFSIISSNGAGSFLDIDVTYAWINSCVLFNPGRPALSVR